MVPQIAFFKFDDALRLKAAVKAINEQFAHVATISDGILVLSCGKSEIAVVSATAASMGGKLTTVAPKTGTKSGHD